jgi:hypothetical protein
LPRLGSRVRVSFPAQLCKNVHFILNDRNIERPVLLVFLSKHPENAGIAQLVEHNLAKVRVASSSLVSRSKGCPGGGMVDTLDLKSNGHYGRAGSSPALGTLGNGAIIFGCSVFCGNSSVGRA